MPLLQYFGSVGSLLVAVLFAANWCCSPAIAPAAPSDVPLNQKVNIRIHTDRKWPERVVFDTSRSSLPPQAKVESELSVESAESPDLAERQAFDAFAEMTAIPAKPCFRPPCTADHGAEWRTRPIAKSTSQEGSRSSIVAGRGITSPSPLHKPPGRS
jgi:hypothetical protein